MCKASACTFLRLVISWLVSKCLSPFQAESLPLVQCRSYIHGDPCSSTYPRLERPRRTNNQKLDTHINSLREPLLQFCL